MATAEERVLALAVARGLLEPGVAFGADLQSLIDRGYLSEADHRLLRQDLVDLDADEANHWSMAITAEAAPLPEGEGESMEPPVTPSGAFLASMGLRTGGIFRARTLERWGRFERLQLLGEGGMGRIFRAVDPGLQREVALKLLRRDDPDILRRFLQEAQLQARVDHPNVCRVYEVGE